jgi:hypothetical protein
MASQGLSWRGMAGHGAANTLRDMRPQKFAWQVQAWLGLADHGAAGRDLARRGKPTAAQVAAEVCSDWITLGESWLVVAMQSEARNGAARCGLARQVTVRRGWARHIHGR